MGVMKIYTKFISINYKDREHVDELGKDDYLEANGEKYRFSVCREL
jgi:hypothetical protein